MMRRPPALTVPSDRCLAGFFKRGPWGDYQLQVAIQEYVDDVHTTPNENCTPTPPTEPPGFQWPVVRSVGTGSREPQTLLG